MSSQKLFRSSEELAAYTQGSPLGVPGKMPVTARLGARPINQMIFRVESAEAAQALAGAFGARDDNGVAASADVAVERAASSSGRALPEDLRSRFESSLGADLSGVRLHTGAESAQAASAVGAKAYTTGNDIHFADGTYDPQSAFGVHLIAHEVAHTVQQHGATPTRQHKLEVSGPADSAEIEADRAADAMVAGAPTAVGTVHARVARQEAEEETGLTTGNDGAEMSSTVNGPYADMQREGEEMTRSRPDPINWDCGPSGLVDGPWQGRPEILNAAYEPGDDDYAGYAYDPGMMEGAAELTAVWDQVQGTWSNIWSLVSPYRQVDKEAETAAALLTDDTSHRESGDQTLANKTKPEGSDASVGGAFNADGTAAGSDRLTEEGLAGKDRDAALKAKKDVDALDIKIESQHLAVKNATLPGVTAINNVTSALAVQIVADSEDKKEEHQKDLTEWESLKESYTNDVSVVKSSAAFITSAAEKKINFGAIADVYQTLLNDSYFKPHIDAIKRAVHQTQRKATRAKVRAAAAAVDTAMAAVEPAFDQVEIARNGLREMMVQREKLMITVSNEAKDLAVKTGAGPEEAARVQAAVRAIPILERVVGQAQAISTAITLPGYTAGSGFGAALTVNIADLTAHVGALKGTKLDMEERAAFWKQRLDSANAMVKNIK